MTEQQVPQLQTPHPRAKALGLKRSLARSAAPYATSDRIRRALFGAVVEETPDPAQEVPESDELHDQLKQLYSDECGRAEETRRRSDQLLTRIIAVSPFVVGTIVLVSRHLQFKIGWASLVLAVIATMSLTLSFWAIAHNLGKEYRYVPLSMRDLLGEGGLGHVSKKTLTKEYYKGVVDNEARNDDTIDRLHFAFGLFVFSVFFGLLGGALLVAILAVEPEADTQEKQEAALRVTQLHAAVANLVAKCDRVGAKEQQLDRLHDECGRGPQQCLQAARDLGILVEVPPVPVDGGAP